MIKAALINLVFLLILACPAPSQTAEQVGAGTTDRESPPASLRAWILPAGERQPLSVVVGSESGENPQTLAGTRDGAMVANAGYASLPPGALKMELKSADKVLVSRSAAVRPERFYTLVCWNAGGKWELQVFADGPLENREAARPVRVLNFVEGRETEFFIGAASGEKVAAESVQETQVPPKQFDVSIKVLDPQGGPPSQTSTAFDFAQADAGYLVIANDYLGRADPRVIAGGPGFVESEPGPEAPYVPPTAEEARKEKQRLLSLELEHRKAQLAALEASEKGPNKIPNAAELRRQIEEEIRKLQKPAAAPAPPSPHCH